MLRRNFLQSLPIIVGLSTSKDKQIEQREGLSLEHFNVLGEYIYAPCDVLIPQLEKAYPSKEYRGKYELSFDQQGKLIRAGYIVSGQNNYYRQEIVECTHGIIRYVCDSSVEPVIEYTFLGGRLHEVYVYDISFKLSDHLESIKELGKNPKTTLCPPVSLIRTLNDELGKHWILHLDG